MNSDFRLPSVTESREAALRRLLASRAIGGHSLTSGDPAPGSLTVFQSSRVARLQDASKGPDLVSLLSSLARSYLDAYMQSKLRPDSKVADMEARLGPVVRRYSVFQHSRRHNVGFIRDLVKAGSVGFVETAAEHVGLFFVAKEAGAQSSLLRDSAMSNFRERLRTLNNWFVGSADTKHAFHQIRIPEWLQSFFVLPAVLASGVGYTGKTINQLRLVPDSLIYLVFTTFPNVFSWAMSFCGEQYTRGKC